MKKSNMSAALYRLIYCSRNVIAKIVPEAADPR